MYLGLDLGTGSLKAVLIDSAGETQWVSSEVYANDLIDERAEIQPARWWDACRILLSAAPRQLLEELAGVGFSGQMHGIVVLDSERTVLRPAVLWHDRRAHVEVEQFKVIDAANPGVLANPILPGMPGPVLSWLRHNEPELWQRISVVLSPKDWLREEFAGTPTTSTDHSDASASLLYDVRQCGWSEPVAQAAGIPVGLLATPMSSTASAGVTGHRAEQLGIPAGTPLSIGAGDAAAALLGLGIERPGTVLLNVGTGAQALTIVDRPDSAYVIDALHQFRTAGADADWYVMASVVNAGLVLDWVRGLIGTDWGGLYALADDALSRDDDPIFTPFLFGERDPRVGLNASAAWNGLSTHHDQAALGRSALVGVASYLAERTRALMAIAGSDRVVLSGGSVRHAGWVQLLTNLLDVDVDVVTDPDVSARGAAITAARAIGHDLSPAAVAQKVLPQADLASRAQDVMNLLAVRLGTSAFNES